MYDVCIIGAGVVGCNLARQLSRYQLNICMIDRADDVSCGATKANSGIVHGAYATKFGTLKAALAREGNLMYDALESELHFGFHRIGAFVLAFNEDEASDLEALIANGIKNGCPSEAMEILTGEQVRAMEPEVSKDVVAALWAKDVGIVSPYEMAIALAENAIVNGVDLKLGNEVMDIQANTEGFSIHTSQGTIQSRYIVNAAGLYSDLIAQMISKGDPGFKILPRKGQYVLLDRQQGKMTGKVLFQVPSKMGKGILVTRTCHGNLMLGPNAEDLETREDYGTDLESLKDVIEKAKKSVPGIQMKRAITTYSGVRAISDNGDFIVDYARGENRCIHLAGIDSPGLTASPAIAKKAMGLLVDSGLELHEKKEWHSSRRAIIRPKTADEVLSVDSEDPSQHMVCRCERVTEAEIVDAIHRGIDIVSTDMIKRRTRAGMGPCQGNYCQPRVAQIILRETGLSEVGRRGPQEGKQPERVPLNVIRGL